MCSASTVSLAFRHPNSTWKEMVAKSKLYGVDPTTKEGETVLYRHLVSVPRPMQLQICLTLPKPAHCGQCATSIYRDEVLRFAENQGTFPCAMDDNHPMAHLNQAPLVQIYTEFHNASVQISHLLFFLTGCVDLPTKRKKFGNH